MACVVIGILGMQVNLAFYGLETTYPISVTGLSIIAIALFKGAAALALWMEEKYAITLAIVDAIFGIIICGMVMMYPLFDGHEGYKFTFRLELVLLIPYLVTLLEVKARWVGKRESRSSIA